MLEWQEHTVHGIRGQRTETLFSEGNELYSKLVTVSGAKYQASWPAIRRLEYTERNKWASLLQQDGVRNLWLYVPK
jgi:hypothetical protein